MTQLSQIRTALQRGDKFGSIARFAKRIVAPRRRDSSIRRYLAKARKSKRAVVEEFGAQLRTHRGRRNVRKTWCDAAIYVLLTRARSGIAWTLSSEERFLDRILRLRQTPNEAVRCLWKRSDTAALFLRSVVNGETQWLPAWVAACRASNEERIIPLSETAMLAAAFAMEKSFSRAIACARAFYPRKVIRAGLRRNVPFGRLIGWGRAARGFFEQRMSKQIAQWRGENAADPEETFFRLLVDPTFKGGIAAVWNEALFRAIVLTACDQSYSKRKVVDVFLDLRIRARRNVRQALPLLPISTNCPDSRLIQLGTVHRTTDSIHTAWVDTCHANREGSIPLRFRGVFLAHLANDRAPADALKLARSFSAARYLREQIAARRPLGWLSLCAAVLHDLLQAELAGDIVVWNARGRLSLAQDWDIMLQFVAPGDFVPKCDALESWNEVLFRALVLRVNPGTTELGLTAFEQFVDGVVRRDLVPAEVLRGIPKAAGVKCKDDAIRNRVLALMAIATNQGQDPATVWHHHTRQQGMGFLWSLLMHLAKGWAPRMAVGLVRSEYFCYEDQDGRQGLRVFATAS